MLQGWSSRGSSLQHQPWHVKVLSVVTWAYICWSLLPLLSVLLDSLNVSPEGLSLKAYEQVLVDERLRGALSQSLILAALTTLIATPGGLGLAIGVARWPGRLRSVARLISFSPLLVPELVLATALFETFVRIFVIVKLGTITQLLGHVTLALPLVAIIMLTALLSLDPRLEESARDLGAPPIHAFALVVLPLIAPASLIAVGVTFTISLNDLVLSQFLCIEDRCETVPMLLFRTGSSPATGALAVAASVLSGLAATLAWTAWRRNAALRSPRLEAHE